MADLSIAIALQISLSADVIDAIKILACAFGHLPATSSPDNTRAPPAATGDSVPNSVRVQPAEGPGRAAGQLGPGLSEKRRASYGRWLTPEREVLLKALWPTMMSASEICAKLSDCDGPPLPPAKLVASRAWALGARRPPEMLAKFHWAKHGQALKADAAPVSCASNEAEETDTPPETALSAALSAAVASRPIEPPAPVAQPVPPNAPPAPVQPPLSRAETLNRIATGIKANPLPVPDTPIVASQEAIRQKAASWGIQMAVFDLDAVNKKARSIGHPGFELKHPERRAAR